MSDFTITSDESEGVFNDFVQDQLDDAVERIINEGDMDRFGEGGSDIIIEMDDIVPPTFVYGDESEGDSGGAGDQPGDEKGKLRFKLPFQTFMELVGKKLALPDLLKEGAGTIKEVSYAFQSFGPVGVLLDKRRTFKRALRSSIGMNVYAPQEGRYDVEVRRRDRRYKIPQRVEKPRYQAVVFYMGDISFSTHGSRLELEKRLVNFIHQWLDFNYGAGNVEHRFFVHDVDAYEVAPEDFYKVSTAGGTRASIVFDLVSQIAYDEYSTKTTNFYGFYFGDGEIFGDDTKEVVRILDSDMQPYFNRIGIVEVQPSEFSSLIRYVKEEFGGDGVIRCRKIKDKKETVSVIKGLFGTTHA